MDQLRASVPTAVPAHDAGSWQFWVHQAARRLWKAAAAIAVILTLITGSVFVLNAAHKAFDAATNWLYPDPLLFALAALVLGLSLALVVSRGQIWMARERQVKLATRADNAEAEVTRLGHQNDPIRQTKDAEVFHAITAALPRDDISYFAEHDFGSPWSRDRTRSLHRLVEEHNAVEDCLLDPELEKLRKDLFYATDALRWSSAKHGVVSGNVRDHFELVGNDWVRNNPPEGLRYERYEANRQELGELADRMVSAYDRLVAAARARLPDA
jgi:hypothetical protein